MDDADRLLGYLLRLPSADLNALFDAPCKPITPRYDDLEELYLYVVIAGFYLEAGLRAFCDESLDGWNYAVWKEMMTAYIGQFPHPEHLWHYSLSELQFLCDSFPELLTA